MCYLKGSRQNFNFLPFLSLLFCFSLKLKPKRKKKIAFRNRWIHNAWMDKEKRGFFFNQLAKINFAVKLFFPQFCLSFFDWTYTEITLLIPKKHQYFCCKALHNLWYGLMPCISHEARFDVAKEHQVQYHVLSKPNSRTMHTRLSQIYQTHQISIW